MPTQKITENDIRLLFSADGSIDKAQLLTCIQKLKSQTYKKLNKKTHVQLQKELKHRDLSQLSPDEKKLLIKLTAYANLRFLEKDNKKTACQFFFKHNFKDIFNADLSSKHIQKEECLKQVLLDLYIEGKEFFFKQGSLLLTNSGSQFEGILKSAGVYSTEFKLICIIIQAKHEAAFGSANFAACLAAAIPHSLNLEHLVDFASQLEEFQDALVTSTLSHSHTLSPLGWFNLGKYLLNQAEPSFELIEQYIQRLQENEDFEAWVTQPDQRDKRGPLSQWLQSARDQQAQLTETAAAPTSALELPPWAEAYQMSLTDIINQGLSASESKMQIYLQLQKTIKEYQLHEDVHGRHQLLLQLMKTQKAAGAQELIWPKSGAYLNPDFSSQMDHYPLSYFIIALQLPSQHSYHSLDGLRQELLNQGLKRLTEAYRHDEDRLDTLFHLAEVYYHGLGEPQNLCRARELYKEAFVKGHLQAGYRLCYMCFYQQGGPVDLGFVDEFFSLEGLDTENPGTFLFEENHNWWLKLRFDQAFSQLLQYQDAAKGYGESTALDKQSCITACKNVIAAMEGKQKKHYRTMLQQFIPCNQSSIAAESIPDAHYGQLTTAINALLPSGLGFTQADYLQLLRHLSADVFENDVANQMKIALKGLFLNEGTLDYRGNTLHQKDSTPLRHLLEQYFVDCLMPINDTARERVESSVKGALFNALLRLLAAYFKHTPEHEYQLMTTYLYEHGRSQGLGVGYVLAKRIVSEAGFLWGDKPLDELHQRLSDHEFSSGNYFDEYASDDSDAKAESRYQSAPHQETADRLAREKLYIGILRSFKDHLKHLLRLDNSEQSLPREYESQRDKFNSAIAMTKREDGKKHPYRIGFTTTKPDQSYYDDLAKLNHAHTLNSLPQAFRGNIHGSYRLAHTRGYHFFRDHWSAKQRRAYRQGIHHDKHPYCSKPVYSHAVYKRAGISDYSDASESTQLRLHCVSQYIFVQLQRFLDNPCSYAKFREHFPRREESAAATENDTGSVLSAASASSAHTTASQPQTHARSYRCATLALALQQEYSNDHKKFHEVFLPWLAKEAGIQLMGNPILSFGDIESEHSFKYAFGEKVYGHNKDNRLRPQYLQTGRALRPYSGFVVLTYSPLEMAAGAFSHHIPSLQRQASLVVEETVLPEREQSVLIRLEEGVIKFIMQAKYPSFHHETYPKNFIHRYGLDRESYFLIKQIIKGSVPHSDKRRLLISSLGAYLSAYHQMYLLKYAYEQLTRKALIAPEAGHAMLVFRDPMGNFSFESTLDLNPSPSHDPLQSTLTRERKAAMQAFLEASESAASALSAQSSSQSAAAPSSTSALSAGFFSDPLKRKASVLYGAEEEAPTARYKKACGGGQASVPR